MRPLLQHLGRFACLTLVFVGIALLSNWPRHRSLPAQSGVLVLSFSHEADRKAACRKLTPDELAKLPPNMRRTDRCPRGRPPIHVALDIDGRRQFDAEVPPSGIAGDGPSRVHERIVLPVGTHSVAVRMRDRPGEEFNWEAERMVKIAPAANRVIDFRPEGGGFVFY